MRYRHRYAEIEAVQWNGFDKGPHDLGVERYDPEDIDDIIGILRHSHRLDSGEMFEDYDHVYPGDFIVFHSGQLAEKYGQKRCWKWSEIDINYTPIKEEFAMEAKVKCSECAAARDMAFPCEAYQGSDPDFGKFAAEQESCPIPEDREAYLKEAKEESA